MHPRRTRPRRDAERSRARGLTILELLVTLTVATIAFGAISSTLVASMSLDRANVQNARAIEAAYSTLEAIKAEPFARAFASYNADPGDDPDGPGTAPGAAFAVAGLDAAGDDGDGFAGEIRFPGDGSTLREDAVDRILGMPRDLNGDGEIDAADHAGDYVFLPVRVRVRWRGPAGDQQVELHGSLISRTGA